MDILGIKIDFISKAEVIEKIVNAVKSQRKYPLFIITANGEFVLNTKKDLEFLRALDKADIVLPDGISLLMARDYIKGLRRLTVLSILLKTLKGGYLQEKVTGIELVRFFLENHKNIKIFLLGGFHNSANALANKYNCNFHPGVSNVLRITEEQNNEILSVINKSNPDILFVSFGHFTQEKWIAKNLENLKCNVVLGVGSSFDEILGIGIWKQPVPKFIEKMGLKWLWRLAKNPKHIGRVWQAVIVFPWRVFVGSYK